MTSDSGSVGSPAEIRRSADASVDRNILLPTAETLGQGEFGINNYNLFMFG